MPARPNAEELEEFLTRAVAQVVVREELERLLRSGERRLRVKQGFDPTTKNLHIGHAVGLRKLKKLAEWGHEIVLIVGDWTTQIGDPTDRDLARPTKSRDEVMENARTYLDQFHLIVPRTGTRTVLQDEWFGRFGLRDVIELTSRFTVQQMLAREEFRKRQTAGTPIPIKDLLYPLLQAYDSIAIQAEVEFGGTDQLFNILAGRELQEMLGQPPQQMMLVHLLEGLDGEKMSKSKPATAVWLTDAPNEMFGKVMAIKDESMPHWFEWATEMPMTEVSATLDALARGELHKRDAKERLARRIVTELHSEAAAEDAAAAFRRQFTDREAPAEVPERTLSRDGEAAIGIVDLLVRIGLASSKSDARRKVEQRGVRVDSVVADGSTTVPTSGTQLIQVGPRNFRRIRWS
ncbi:MAG: tyrosine--tRNA ligase [Chloroflexi bacterium RIFCSPLOWO2_12_FULL_71_12]|nr:MAG: tyrosine--tRNA ligase [Chloroflexi bacterium RIFCSPLOWO2_02_FULL_71_16]OGO73675.1 MAG: tyrosine--tRNA ligase [Chloroflexi bacterium RIFCSPLOWO2_12_FULL_71_12]